jgi:transposase
VKRWLHGRWLVRYVGGDLQGRFMARVRGVDPQRCLAVPVDVGKWSAMALVADHHGEVVVAPFVFRLDEPGVRGLLSAIEMAVIGRGAVVCRVGVESAGHYHRTLVARLRGSGVEVVELNPAAVKEARAQQLLRRLKSDERDLGAMVELLVRGAGRLPQVRDDAMAAQVAWAAHRRRKVAAHVALSNQVQGHLDLVFPGLGACFDGILHTKAGRVIVRDLADPDRMRRLGVEGLRRFVARRGVMLQRHKAAQLLEAAKVALRLPAAERPPVAALLAADVALLDAIGAEIGYADDALAKVLGATPAGVLLSLPGVGVVRASAYGAAIGDPARFPNAGAAYRASGLVPAEYSSAGRRRGGQHISREGSVDLRSAIIELGRGLAGHDEDFAAYRRRLRNNGKRPAVAAVAVGHRAHRLAFAMLRSQEPYDAKRWTAAAADGPVMAKTGGRPTRTT